MRSRGAAPPRQRPGRPARLLANGLLAARVWWAWLVVAARMRRRPLPEVAGGAGPLRRHRQHPVGRLSRAVDRCMRLGPWQPRCLTRALVLHRLLQAQGDPAALVIGLPADPSDQRAHAWVELGGRDLGPRPGRNGHVELVRYGR